eukprot:6176221-Pleurochrysis_carterae.AAC.1
MVTAVRRLSSPAFVQSVEVQLIVLLDTQKPGVKLGFQREAFADPALIPQRLMVKLLYDDTPQCAASTVVGRHGGRPTSFFQSDFRSAESLHERYSELRAEPARKALAPAHFLWGLWGAYEAMPPILSIWVHVHTWDRLTATAHWRRIFAA